MLHIDELIDAGDFLRTLRIHESIFFRHYFLFTHSEQQ
jgi:hypothetical protein